MTKTPLKHRITHLLLTLFLITPVFGHTAEQAEEKVATLDKIVAIVDSDVITRTELDARMTMIMQQIEKQGTKAPPQDVLEKQVLERIISDRLQLAFAEQTGIRVDDAQLNKTLERIADQNKLSLPDFKAALDKEGINFDKFREDIRKEIIIARLREREIDSKVTVTEAEIDNALTTQNSGQDSNDEYDVAHIMVRVPEQSSPEDIQKLRAKIEDALKKLQGGADFAQVSAAMSDAPKALEGGDLGWKKPTELPELFQDALKPLKKGELSAILRSPNGFHILKMVDRRGDATPMIVQQTHVRHILIKPSEVLSDTEAKQRMDSIKERLDNGGNFEELARQYSEDGTASKGGDLGWVNPGDLVPEFEKVMDGLTTNQISEPIKSRFGWHIIQVLGRRDQDVSKQAARLKIREAIKARKADEMFQDWLHGLRDRAYVEYRNNDKDD
ncbi:MAG TPA: peptidylprolyl isomerase [Methylophilaceae bacterium]|jgi:peptidyl-prolyl cis-trans isomerase SurA